MSFNYIKGYFLLALPAWREKTSKELKETVFKIWENVKSEPQKSGTLDILYKEEYDEMLKIFTIEELAKVWRTLYYLTHWKPAKYFSCNLPVGFTGWEVSNIIDQYLRKNNIGENIKLLKVFHLYGI